MVDRNVIEDMDGHVEKLEPISPGVDYGLKNDDGFDPSKYDFYNPSYRTAGKAFVVRLDEYVLDTWCALIFRVHVMLKGLQGTSGSLHQVQ